VSKAEKEDRQYFHFGPFVFDVDEALAIIEKSPREVSHVDIPTTARQLGLEQSDEERMAEIKKTGQGFVPILRGEVDEQYALTKADLDQPLIFVDLAKGEDEEPAYMMIDGTHRVRRAFVEGVDFLEAYVLTREETLKVRSEKYYR
jgi:hypothetical protein